MNKFNSARGDTDVIYVSAQSALNDAECCSCSWIRIKDQMLCPSFQTTHLRTHSWCCAEIVTVSGLCEPVMKHIWSFVHRRSVVRTYIYIFIFFCTSLVIKSAMATQKTQVNICKTSFIIQSVEINKCILQVLDAVKVSSVLLHSRTPAVRG